MAKVNAKPKLKEGHGLPGFFVTFEGGEGTGKSTQARMLAERLEKSGYSVVVTREPGGSPGAEIVREALLSGHAEKLGPEVEAMLFSLARLDHLDCVIKPALDSGAIVICDRFLDSTRAYQGTSDDVPPAVVTGLETIAVGSCLPDLTILLDMPAASGLARAKSRAAGASDDRFEKEDEALHEARRQRFLAIAKSEPNRFVVIDADRDADVIFSDVINAVENAMTDRKPALAVATE